MGKMSREDRIVMNALRVTTYEWKKLEFTPLYERICEPKVVEIAPQSTHQKSGCWITIWQFYWSRSYVRLSSEPVLDVHVRIHVAPLACYAFINIKLASCHLLLYVLCLCQNHKMLFMHSFVTNKNVKCCHLILATLYICPRSTGPTEEIGPVASAKTRMSTCIVLLFSPYCW